MQIPVRLVELQRAVDAADARYHSNQGINSNVALAVWSDANAALTDALIAHAADSGIPYQTLESAVQHDARQPVSAPPEKGALPATTGAVRAYHDGDSVRGDEEQPLLGRHRAPGHG